MAYKEFVIRYYMALGLGIGIWLSLVRASSTDPDTESLRAAVNNAKLSLGRSAAVAQENVPSGVAIKAKLIPESNPGFSVGASAAARCTTSGSTPRTGRCYPTVSGGRDDPCPGSYPRGGHRYWGGRIGGTAVQIHPDDDDRCHREVIVLADNDQLWGS